MMQAAVLQRPQFTPEDAAQLAGQHYGLTATATLLPGERDRNFRLATADGDYVLKISHPAEDPALLEAQFVVLGKLAQLDRPVFPRVLPAITGNLTASAQDARGLPHTLWLIPFLPGVVAAQAHEPSAALLHDIGSLLGQMDRMLAEVEQPALQRTFQWDAAAAPQLIRSQLALHGPARRQLLEQALHGFTTRTAGQLPSLRRSVIHNDVNDYNLLVQGDRVSGIVDFGDLLESFTGCELAHACAYLMLDKADPLAVALAVARGYQAAWPLSGAELRLLLDFIVLRLALSVTLSKVQQQLEPTDPYLSISERPAWALLERLVTLGTLDVRAARAAFAAMARCGGTV
jgi:Ser/Thr protein kinase RdoA (MazF antagonist)